MIQSPSITLPLERNEFEIFRRYTTCVVPFLVPMHDHHNPWTNYPCLALEYKSKGQLFLLHAIMAHAALAMAHFKSAREELFSLGLNFHTMALKELRIAISEGSTDTVSLFTTIVTFLLIEVCELIPSLAYYLIGCKVLYRTV